MLNALFRYFHGMAAKSIDSKSTQKIAPVFFCNVPSLFINQLGELDENRQRFAQVKIK